MKIDEFNVIELIAPWRVQSRVSTGKSRDAVANRFQPRWLHNRVVLSSRCFDVERMEGGIA